MSYGKNITVGTRVEISPHFDLWMRGAKFGVVKKIDLNTDVAEVKMDHHQVRKIQRFPISELIGR